MARMSEEVYELKQEIREQKDIANQARNRRGTTGKSGKVRLSSDNLTQKQWEAKNGAVKSYRMNDPMTWEQFNELPDDLKVMYIKAIRKKYNTPDYILAACMGVDVDVFKSKLQELGLRSGNVSTQWFETESSFEFNKWWHKTNNETKPVTKGGTLETEGNVEEDLKKLMETLKGHNVRLKVDWEIMED